MVAGGWWLVVALVGWWLAAFWWKMSPLSSVSSVLTKKTEKKRDKKLDNHVIWALKRGPQNPYVCACPPSNSPPTMVVPSLKPEA